MGEQTLNVEIAGRTVAFGESDLTAAVTGDTRAITAKIAAAIVASVDQKRVELAAARSYMETMKALKRQAALKRAGVAAAKLAGAAVAGGVLYLVLSSWWSR